MTEILAGFLVLVGGGFAVIAAVGMIKFGDVLTRMHASTKAGTLASSLVLIAVALVYRDLGVAAKCVSTVAFLLLTAPIAAHMIGRASLDAGTHPRRQGPAQASAPASHSVTSG